MTRSDPSQQPSERLAEAFQTHRRALQTFLTRMVVREEIAEELVQELALRALEQTSLPQAEGELRAWFFRVATNLAIDYLRRHGTWREELLDDTRSRAVGDAGFVAESKLLAGSAEMKAVAREHLAVCFSCTARNLAPQESAALWLKEVYDFSVEEVASMLDSSFGQAKAWIQQARAKLSARYAASCALVTQSGVCFQCVELDTFFRADQGDPLAGSARDLDARLVILRRSREAPMGPWHRQMMRLVDEVLDEQPQLTVTRRGSA